MICLPQRGVFVRVRAGVAADGREHIILAGRENGEREIRRDLRPLIEERCGDTSNEVSVGGGLATSTLGVGDRNTFLMSL